MNLRNKLKKFFTLSRQHEAGFTLVELIVVIAILAILGGVGTVAYSGYVKKANIAADEALVSEIEKALTLAMYNNLFVNEPAGILIVNTNGITLNGGPIEAGSEMDTALTAAFGPDYENVLLLKYDGWKIASHVNGMTSDEATIVNGSSYLSGNRADLLLSDVEKFTDMAANLSEAMTGTALGDTTLASLYGQSLLDKTAAKYNISVEDEYKTNGSVDWDAWGKDHPQEFSNMLVLATALDNQNYMTEQTNGNFDVELSGASNLIKDFSSYYAFASTCPEFSSVLTQYMDAMNTASTTDEYTTINGVNVYKVTNPGTGATWYRQLEAEVGKYKNEDGLTYAEYTTPYLGPDSLATDDQFAFQFLMGALSNASAEDIGDKLGDPNLFTEGTVKNMYDQYLDAVVSMSGTSGLTINTNNGIAIIYNVGNHRVVNTANQ